MLRLPGGQVESLWEEVPPEKLREKRLAGEPIKDRLVSLFDPDARPIRRGKLGKQTEFGYVRKLAEVTSNTKPAARGFILPPATKVGNPNENELLPQTVWVEGRISHLKRRHGLRRSRLKGAEGERTWTGWAAFAYNVETHGHHA